MTDQTPIFIRPNRVQAVFGRLHDGAGPILDKAGAAARQDNTTSAQRSEIARKAAAARWE